MYYPEWLEWQKQQKAKRKREQLNRIVGSFTSFVGAMKDSAIFYNGKSRKPCVCKAKHESFRVCEVIAALVFFAVLIGGLNAIAFIL